VLALELGRCTAATRHRFAPTDITIITRMLARRTATTDQIGSTAACLLAPDRGSMDFTGVAAIGAAAGAVVAIGAAGDLTGADVDLKDEAALTAADEASTDEAGLDAAGPLGMDPLAADSAVIAVAASTAEVAAGSTAAVVAVASTVEEAVDSTAVAEAMAAATGN
jgi:hypothetical protein